MSCRVNIAVFTSLEEAEKKSAAMARHPSPTELRWLIYFPARKDNQAEAFEYGYYMLVHRYHIYKER